MIRPRERLAMLIYDVKQIANLITSEYKFEIKIRGTISGRLILCVNRHGSVRKPRFIDPQIVIDHFGIMTQSNPS